MTTLDIRHMAQLLEAQSLDMATLQDGKALLEELRRTTAHMHQANKRMPWKLGVI